MKHIRSLLTMIQQYTITSKHSEILCQLFRPLESPYACSSSFRTHLCSYDLNLTYPQNGIIPSVAALQPSLRQIPFALRRNLDIMSELRLRYSRQSQQLNKRDRALRHHAWKRDLSLRANGTIDPWVCGSDILHCGHWLTVVVWVLPV